MAVGRPLLVTLRALGLGDLLTAVPALRALARALPEHLRVLVGPSWLAGLVELVRVDGRAVVDGMADADFKVAVGRLDPDLPAVAADGAVVAEGIAEPDVAVNLHGRGPQSTRALAELTPRRLIAHGSIEAGHDGPAWTPEAHEVERWCDLLEASGIPADPGELEIDRPDRSPPDVAVGATVIHPGAASRARRWPVERWAQVAVAEQARGRPVVVTGGPGEVGLARRVADAARIDDAHVLAGATSVVDVAAVVAHAGRVVCGDTGIAHLAVALGTPSLALFGPTPPTRWGPAIRPDLHRVRWAGTAGDPHADVPDAGLLAIGVDDVIDDLADLPTAS